MEQIKQIWDLAKSNPKVSVAVVIAVIAIIALLN
tara:strand:- start:592 stop:693 length:102 start_codon:yes stop_codon:yes gene_type:complete